MDTTPDLPNLQHHSQPDPQKPEPQSDSDRHVDKILTAIALKGDQLNTTGFTPADRSTFKRHLKSIWTKPSFGEGVRTTTRWRRETVYEAFRDIQNASDHLFLLVILAVAPTECTKTSFRRVKEALLQAESYENYKVNLHASERRFFESEAVEQKLSGNDRYLKFMDSLFPRVYSNAYSGIPPDKINEFLSLLREGIEDAKMRKIERERGDERSQSVVGIFPYGDEDVTFQITVARKNALQAIGICDFQGIML